jgi:alkaline phosphatase
VRKFFFFLLVLFEINAYSDSSPKNIIILIGDGMGVNYVSTSVLSLKNDPFRRFTTSGFSVTCSADKLVTDSAAGGTAIATGYRTNNLTISINPETEAPMLTLFELAERFNKSTGLVVTCSVTHATPAVFVAHVKNRGMELEIARQFLNRKLDVVIGGGKKYFTPKSLGGDRSDEFNLITSITNNSYNYYDSYEKLKNDKPGNKFYALFEPVGLPKAADRDYSLGDLTKIALEYLSQQSNGFVMMIEGSQIDWAGHANNLDYLLTEMEDFNTALNTALDFAEKDGETLVVVTADHETGGMNIIDGDANGCDLDLEFATKDHTASMVGVFAKGPGEEEFSGVMDNYMIGRKLFKMLDSSYQF